MTHYFDLVAQIIIVLTGAPAIFLVGTKGKYRRYGFLLGMIGSPFWFLTCAINGQDVMQIVNICFTVSWINGFQNNWRSS